MNCHRLRAAMLVDMNAVVHATLNQSDNAECKTGKKLHL